MVGRVSGSHGPDATTAQAREEASLMLNFRLRAVASASVMSAAGAQVEAPAAAEAQVAQAGLQARISR